MRSNIIYIYIIFKNRHDAEYDNIIYLWTICRFFFFLRDQYGKIHEYKCIPNIIYSMYYIICEVIDGHKKYYRVEEK